MAGNLSEVANQGLVSAKNTVQTLPGHHRLAGLAVISITALVGAGVTGIVQVIKHFRA